jgi:CheY-like chemotaxis protein
MFTQVNRTLDRSQGGLGIGLALVKRLVEMHGGTIAAESPGANQGSTFTVRLPLAPAPAEASPPELPAGGRAATAGLKVLIADDNEDAADSLATLLELSGHEARTAYSGATAVAAAEAFSPDVVFLDLGMPGMSGYEVAKRLRAEPRHAGTRLVALTGWGNEEDRQKTAAAGFDFHLTKPADTDEVRRLLTEIAAGRGAAG